MTQRLLIVFSLVVIISASSGGFAYALFNLHPAQSSTFTLTANGQAYDVSQQKIVSITFLITGTADENSKSANFHISKGEIEISGYKQLLASNGEASINSKGSALDFEMNIVISSSQKSGSWHLTGSSSVILGSKMPVTLFANNVSLPFKGNLTLRNLVLFGQLSISKHVVS